MNVQSEVVSLDELPSVYATILTGALKESQSGCTMDNPLSTKTQFLIETICSDVDLLVRFTARA